VGVLGHVRQLDQTRRSQLPAVAFCLARLLHSVAGYEPCIMQ